MLKNYLENVKKMKSEFKKRIGIFAYSNSTKFSLIKAFNMPLASA